MESKNHYVMSLFWNERWFCFSARTKNRKKNKQFATTMCSMHLLPPDFSDLVLLDICTYCNTNTDRQFFSFLARSQTKSVAKDRSKNYSSWLWIKIFIWICEIWRNTRSRSYSICQNVLGTHPSASSSLALDRIGLDLPALEGHKDCASFCLWKIHLLIWLSGQFKGKLLLFCF